MDNQPTMNISDIINVLKKDKPGCIVRRKKISLYDIDPWEFQSFAKQDLEEDTKKAKVNALSNAKRAIECRVDELLTFFNLSYFSSDKHWGLRYKIEVIKQFNVNAPDVVLDYIAKKRNLLEHEYMMPKSTEDTKYLAGIAELFLAATDKYIKPGYISSAIISDHKETKKLDNNKISQFILYRDVYDLSFDLEKEQISISFHREETGSSFKLGTNEILSIGPTKVMPIQASTVIEIKHCKDTEIKELMQLIMKKEI